jgi:hypothetical protein
MTTYTLATTQPVFWAVKQGATIIAAGTTPTNAITFAADTNTMISDVSENTFLGKAAGAAGSYRPLPATGTPLLTGEIYGYGGGLVMVRQSHNRTADAPADVPALFTVYRAGAADVLDWVAGEAVIVGTRRTYDGKTWEALQAHQTQADWQPPNVPALWREIVVTPPPGAWAFPVAYTVGQRVTYLGLTYECRQAHTSQAGWFPPAVPALWLAV